MGFYTQPTNRPDNPTTSPASSFASTSRERCGAPRATSARPHRISGAQGRWELRRAGRRGQRLRAGGEAGSGAQMGEATAARRPARLRRHPSRRGQRRRGSARHGGPCERGHTCQQGRAGRLLRQPARGEAGRPARRAAAGAAGVGSSGGTASRGSTAATYAGSSRRRPEPARMQARSREQRPQRPAGTRVLSAMGAGRVGTSVRQSGGSGACSWLDGQAAVRPAHGERRWSVPVP